MLHKNLRDNVKINDQKEKHANNNVFINWINSNFISSIP